MSAAPSSGLVSSVIVFISSAFCPIIHLAHLFSHLAEKVFHWSRRYSTIPEAGRNICHDAAHCGDLNAISDRDMTIYARSTADQDAVADLCRTGDSSP